MAFDANEVKVSYILNLAQVNLILEGLSKLPYERVDQFLPGFRGVAEAALKEAMDEPVKEDEPATE